MNNLEPIKKEVNTVTSMSNKIQIKTSEDVVVAVNFLKQVVAAKKRVVEFFAPQKQATHKAWQVVLEQEKKILEPLIAAEALVKNKKTAFDLTQEKIAAEQRRIAEEKAQREEEKIRAKLQKKMEKTKDEEKQAVLQEELESVHVQRDCVTAMPTKVQGSSTQTDYKIEVYNPSALLRAILDEELNILLENVVDIKISAVKKYVQMTGDMKIPGVTVEKTLIQKVSSK